MNRTRSLAAPLSLAALALSLVACAKREAPPLPGDSVSEDGAVRLTPKGTVIAQPTGAMPSPSPNGPGPAEAPAPLGVIESKVFPPELVMDHQVALGLRPEQLSALQKEVERGQKDMLRLQWELAREKEKLAALLEADGGRIDEAKSAEAAAELMKRENAIKAAHLAMLVRVKNLLAPEQQAKLRALRDEDRRGR